MDLDVLKEMLNAFRDVGAEARIAFIWYLVVSCLPTLLIGGAWTFIGGMALFRVLRLIQAVSHSGRLLNAYGSSCPGLEFPAWEEDDLGNACRILREARTRG